MDIQVYINFNGNCREAVEFYTKVFKTEEPEYMTFGEGPANPEFPIPEEAKHLIMHTYLNIGGTKVMFSDTFPGMPFKLGNNISLTVVSKDIDEVKSMFNIMKEGGTLGMDLQETFWSKCYGSLTDKFGIEWQFSYNSEEMM